MSEFRFRVAGDPVAQPRLRPVLRRSGRLGVLMPGTAQAWRDRVAIAASAVWRNAPIEGAIEVDLEFLLARPRSHVAASGKLRPRAPKFPTARPDLDNLMKSTCDALNGLLWNDDAQVVGGRVSKRYAGPEESPGLTVTVRRAE